MRACASMHANPSLDLVWLPRSSRLEAVHWVILLNLLILSIDMLVQVLYAVHAARLLQLNHRCEHEVEVSNCEVRPSDLGLIWLLLIGAPYESILREMTDDRAAESNTLSTERRATKPQIPERTDGCAANAEAHPTAR